jgi:protein involved in polysaccharide export with SLBB domain
MGWSQRRQKRLPLHGCASAPNCLTAWPALWFQTPIPLMNRTSFWQILALLVCAAGLLPAAEPAPAPPQSEPVAATNMTLSAVATPKKRGQWQQRLTLGSGDTLNIALFDMPDTAHTEVPVAPDGRITFLQARDIVATGLTVDELRAKLDEALGKYYQNPRTVVTPVAFNSKKYFVLGAVVNRGVFTLDRPLTLIEVLARAGGLETGVYERNTVELADLAHSFLVRNGQRIPVDFERLFQQGDLTQNIPVEPDDYLYFSLASANEIYVLGEVLAPGVAAFLPRTSVIGAISARGGFTTKAYKQRVLVVRGSLNHPQTFVVNTSAILGAKEPDFRLQSKDIVYVSKNPFVKAEELLDVAASAFISSFLVTTISRKVQPIITSPVFP